MKFKHVSIYFTLIVLRLCHKEKKIKYENTTEVLMFFYNSENTINTISNKMKILNNNNENDIFWVLKNYY